MLYFVSLCHTAIFLQEKKNTDFSLSKRGMRLVAFCQMGMLDCCQSFYLTPTLICTSDFQLVEGGHEDRNDAVSPLRRSFLPFPAILSGPSTHPPLPASTPHLAVIELYVWCDGGVKCRVRQSDTGVSSSDPDVLIPWCLVTLAGSDSLAK